MKEASENREAQGKPGEIVVFDLQALTHFRDEGPYVQVLSDVGAARVVLFAFKAGQQLKEHRTSSQIQVQALSGRVEFAATGQSVELEAGVLLQLEANIPHSVTALSDAVILVTMTPSPSYHSLEREVFQHAVPLVRRVSD
jgi:quercetin dioxygenase-like cupin family protein